MAQVGSGEGPAGVALTAFINGVCVAGEGSVHQVDPAGAGERGVVTGETGGQDAIENVHPASDAVDQVFRCAHTHQVAGFIGGQQRVDHLEHLVHLLLGFAHGEPADGVAGQVERGDEAGGLGAQVREDAALDDAKERLVGAGFGGDAAFQPGVGPLHGFADVWQVIRDGALVERHDDVRAKLFLYGDGTCGGEAVGRAVDVAFEGDPVRIHLACI